MALASMLRAEPEEHEGVRELGYSEMVGLRRSARDYRGHEGGQNSVRWFCGASIAAASVFATMIVWYSSRFMQDWGSPTARAPAALSTLWDESRYRTISAGRCSDLGWDPISMKAECEAGARELSLVVTEADITNLGEWPPGCHYFPKPGAEYLVLNTNAVAGNLGAASDRQSICMVPPQPMGTVAPATTTMISIAPHEDKAEKCSFVVGTDGSNVCPSGTVGLRESECKTMPYHFGGLLHAPFTVNSAVRPKGCFFEYPWYSYNTHPLGRPTRGQKVYCKRCQRGEQLPPHHSSSMGDWSDWSSQPGTSTSRYRRISMANCADIGWRPIWDTTTCAAAAHDIGLSNTRVESTLLQERPEGCYYFRNYMDGTATLWVNNNPYSKGNGAETSDLAQGKLRQPICTSVAPKDASGAPQSTAWTGAIKYRKLTEGTCEGAGGSPVNDQPTCQQAAQTLGLIDTSAQVTHLLNRPEGCYYFRNLNDLTATLWLNTNPANVGRGTETSNKDEGKLRQPVCYLGDGNGQAGSEVALG
mmetsp:Transcript_4267/g.12010  ORF Transcript_4267/g.12010 Transcript_4267/m.12010 type:complete len:531 (-) Transcript_4267:141-1733(-)